MRRPTKGQLPSTQGTAANVCIWEREDLGKSRRLKREVSIWLPALPTWHSGALVAAGIEVFYAALLSQ